MLIGWFDDDGYDGDVRLKKNPKKLFLLFFQVFQTFKKIPRIKNSLLITPIDLSWRDLQKIYWVKAIITYLISYFDSQLRRKIL